MEVWKDIPGYEGLYQVSNLGKVKSVNRILITNNGQKRSYKGKNLIPSIGSSGYYGVSISNKKGIKRFRVHILVAMAFLDHKAKGYTNVVDHINNNPLDNRVENLQIVSHRLNCSKDKKGYTSKYVGVRWSKRSKKWRAQITINKKEVHLGLFTDEHDAHLAYQKALSILQYENKILNTAI